LTFQRVFTVSVFMAFWGVRLALAQTPGPANLSDQEKAAIGSILDLLTTKSGADLKDASSMKSMAFQLRQKCGIGRRRRENGAVQAFCLPGYSRLEMLGQAGLLSSCGATWGTATSSVQTPRQSGSQWRRGGSDLAAVPKPVLDITAKLSDFQPAVGQQLGSAIQRRCTSSGATPFFVSTDRRANHRHPGRRRRSLGSALVLAAIWLLAKPGWSKKRLQ